MKDKRTWTVKKPMTKEEHAEAINKRNKQRKNISNDIIISTKIENKTYNEDGSITITYETKKTNLTKQINETAKLLKQEQAEKMKELQAYFEYKEKRNNE